MVKRIVLIILTMVLFACGSFPDDPSISSVDSNYSSLEIYGQNKLFNGLAVFEAIEGSSFKDLNISIQGYYSGDLRIVSEDCEIDEARTYEKNQKISLNYPLTINSGCLFSVVLSVSYPSSGPVVVHPFKGHFYIAVKKKTRSENRTLKTAINRLRNIEINFKEDATVYFRGCGSSSENKIRVNQGKIRFKLDEYFQTEIKRTCLIQLALVGEHETKRVRILTSFYSDRYFNIATPVTKFSKRKLKITAIDAVAVTSVGPKYRQSNKGKFKYKEGDTVRLITSKGRLLLGSIKGWDIIWKP